ncbi:MAG TPA: hypothetical protein VNQ79_11105 [Blastocatellia bacterium]|nr:hypothetical protein [Blastocatellia bacterium]
MKLRYLMLTVALALQKFTLTKSQMHAADPNDGGSGQRIDPQPGTPGSAFRGASGFKDKASGSGYAVDDKPRQKFGAKERDTVTGLDFAEAGYLAEDWL